MKVNKSVDNRHLKTTLFFMMSIIILGGIFFVTNYVSAQTAQQAVSLQNPLGTTDIRVIIGRIINAFLGIIGAIALLMFILGGYRWLISAGNSKQVEAGKQTLIWATLGLLIVFSSYLLVSFILGALTR